MNTREVLIAARSLIAEESKWANCILALGDKHCMVSAIGDVTFGADEKFDVACLALSRAIGCQQWQVPSFNDTHTHAEVIAAFDRAIASCTDISSLTALLDASVLKDEAQ